MLPKRLFRLINKVALFAIIFASLAPSISHALATQDGTSIAQEVCTSSGKKLTVQAFTTKGQQPAALFDDKSESDTAPKGINHHLEHCPFCANPSADVAMAIPHAPLVVLLTVRVQHIAATSQVALTSFSVLPPPSQAPPTL